MRAEFKAGLAGALALAALCGLAACDDGGNRSKSEIAVTGSRAQVAPAAPPPPPMPAPVADMAEESGYGGTDAMASDGDTAPDPAVDPAQPAGMLLAYSYHVGLELPLRNVEAVRDRHEAACRAAGPQTCLVLGGSISGDGETYMYADLAIRAAPDWLAEFRDGLAGDAEDAGGRIADSSVSAEDLTRSIVDTDARLQAQETLRDRLLVLLERPTDEVDDLLAVERELARVQGQIDSARSQLAVMRARVDMSRLDLNYRAAPRAVSAGAFQPVSRALTDFLSTLASSLAVVITIIAAAIPFVLILIPLIILVWRWFRRRRKRA